MLSELIGKEELKSFELREVSEVYQEGREDDSHGFFLKADFAEVWVQYLTKVRKGDVFKTRRVLALTDGKSLYVVADTERLEFNTD